MSKVIVLWVYQTKQMPLGYSPSGNDFYHSSEIILDVWGRLLGGIR